MTTTKVLNINVGVLGHVDSGKTSLVKALSTTLSTAALDKSPQSRERGITLDLGFSSFTVAAPEHFPKDEYTHVQFTLVDCPGHASLIRTIIGGAQIMDMLVLVIDATKGMQAQTVECVVIGEAVMAHDADVIIVLNKVDLMCQQERQESLGAVRKAIEARLARTKLSKASFVSCAAAVGGEKTVASASVPKVTGGGRGKGEEANKPSGLKKAAAGGSASAMAFGDNLGTGNVNGQTGQRLASSPQACRDEAATMGIDSVATELTRRAKIPSRVTSSNLYFAFDHCFSVRGQGTILTGTVLRGEVKINQLVELPALRVLKRVKSMQMFRKPVSMARHARVSAGDRVGICLANLDAKLLERGEVTTPGTGQPISSAVALIRKVPAFRGRCRSGSYCHVSLGHTTVIATATFFGASELKNQRRELFWDVGVGAGVVECGGGKETTSSAEDENKLLDKMASSPFPFDAEFLQQEDLVAHISSLGQDPSVVHESLPSNPNLVGGTLQYCHLAFHTPVIAPPSSVVLGSRLDIASDFGTGDSEESEAGSDHCRIAFYGRLIPATGGGAKASINSCSKDHLQIEFGVKAGQIKVFTEKIKTGSIFRVGDGDGSRKSEVVVLCKDLFKKETNTAPFLGMILMTEHGSMGRIESAFGKAGRFKARFPAGTSVKAGDTLFLKFRKYLRDQSKQMHQGYLQRALQVHLTAQDAREIPDKAGFSDSDAEAHDGPPSDSRKGVIDSVRIGQDCGGTVAIVSGLFSQEEDIRALAKQGITVRTSSGARGELRGPFGKLGKCKVEFSHGVSLQVGEFVLGPRRTDA